MVRFRAHNEKRNAWVFATLVSSTLCVVLAISLALQRGGPAQQQLAGGAAEAAGREHVARLERLLTDSRRALELAQGAGAVVAAAGEEVAGAARQAADKDLTALRKELEGARQVRRCG